MCGAQVRGLGAQNKRIFCLAMSKRNFRGKWRRHVNNTLA